MTFPIYLIPSRKLEMSGKIYVFDVLYNLRNSARFHPQNALNRISGTQNLKIFPGYIPRTPLDVRFAPPEKIEGLATPLAVCATKVYKTLKYVHY